MQTDIVSCVKTVKELTNQIKGILEDTFAYIWVKGEVGPVKIHSSGHCYFSLKEEDIVINAICWKGTVIPFELKEGLVVECYCRVSVFGARSSYQIIVKEIREVSNKGNIFLQLEALKKKLVAEGVFNLKNKDSIMEFPRKVAILTSPTGAVLHDMMHRINDRYPCLEVLFFPVSVQGSEAQKSILEALNKVENFLDIDIVILARGGGSIEDLWVFNDEVIVRRVANFRLPIISAIGHETDTTLCDYAANLRAPTPTAAIELCVPDKNELIISVTGLYDNFINFIYEKIKNFEGLLAQFEDNSVWYSNAIDGISQKLDNLFFIINDLVKDRINKYEMLLLQDNSINYALDKVEYELVSFFDKSVDNIFSRVDKAFEFLVKDELFIVEKEKELKEKIMVFDLDKKRVLSRKDIKDLNFKPFSLNFLDGSIDVVEFE